MRATTIFTAGSNARPKTRDRSTAYYVFDRDNFFTFDVDAASFRARNKTLNLPVVSTGGIEDLTRISRELIHTAGTIWDMVRYFYDGANLRLQSTADAKTVYRRILEHLEAHLTAMRTDVTYIPPSGDDFRQMAEFAIAIRSIALDEDKHLDDAPEAAFFAAMPVRPTFSREAYYGEEDTPTQQAPKITQKMDAIDRYLEMIGYD